MLLFLIIKNLRLLETHMALIIVITIFNLPFVIEKTNQAGIAAENVATAIPSPATFVVPPVFEFRSGPG